MKKFAVILLTICLMSVMLCACTADSGGMDADAETPEPNNDFYDWGMDHISMKDISPTCSWKCRCTVRHLLTPAAWLALCQFCATQAMTLI